MKIATYNIQNLFHRDKGLVKESRLLKQDSWNEELEHLFIKKFKKEKEYIRMRELAVLLGFNKAPFDPYVSLKNLDGNLMIESGDLELGNKASEINEWNGWLELSTNPISELAIRNKAKVILEVNPDILFLQEVENRASLIQFNNRYLREEMKEPYSEIIHLDGNNSKGMGMGVLLKKRCRITAIRSFSNERDINDEPLFDKNVLQFGITDLNGREIYILSCQFIFESDDPKQEGKRKRQADKVASICRELKSEGYEEIIVLGNLNAPCYSKSLAPLLQETDFKDVVKHDSFEVDLDLGNHSGYYRMGGYRKGVNIKQRDYLLLPHSLYDNVECCGLNRKAVWPSKMPKWPLYDLVRNELDAASEYPLLWVSFNLETTVELFKKSA